MDVTPVGTTKLCSAPVGEYSHVAVLNLTVVDAAPEHNGAATAGPGAPAAATPSARPAPPHFQRRPPGALCQTSWI